MTRIEQLKGYIGQKVNGVSFNIDIINACPLRCPSCAIGSIGRRKGGYMSIGLFKSIMDKAESECRVRKVQMYAYSDPCLHPKLDEFISDLTGRGIESTLSTMLQTTNCDWEKLIEARPTELRISFPGWKKMEYYQRNAKPGMFDEKFRRVAGLLPRYLETKWTMAFHLYNDNEDELPRVQALAKEFNLHLVVLPAIFMPCEKVVEKTYTEQDKELISHLLETPEESISKMVYSQDYCQLWKQVTIDAEGMVYLCQLVYEDRFRLMNFLDLPLKEIQKTISTHSFCGSCMKAGGHVYQFCYSDFTKYDDPVGHANKKRRK